MIYLRNSLHLSSRSTECRQVQPAERTLWYRKSESIPDTWEGEHTYVRWILVQLTLLRHQTKHFQTLFWTPEIRLVDCPGLVFPSHVSMELQVNFDLCIPPNDILLTSCLDSLFYSPNISNFDCSILHSLHRLNHAT